MLTEHLLNITNEYICWIGTFGLEGEGVSVH